jgi:hypothetical protein
MRDFQAMIENQRSRVRERVAGAMGRIEAACGQELRNFLQHRHSRRGPPPAVHAGT